MDSQLTIPKMIHYCWFGRNPLPEDALKCIASWKKYCPDYEIKRWDESNFDINACMYIREAYKAKKWAFVSDYARFVILYTYGGVYFDTDVELIRPIGDILDKGDFFGAEQTDSKNTLVAPGLGMAAAPGHPLYAEILSAYQEQRFIREDGTYNQVTIVKYTTDLLQKYGLQDTQDIQRVKGIWIYPWDYFCPMKYPTGQLTVTPNTRSIHHYSATWFSKEAQRNLQITIKASKCFGETIGRRIGRIHSFPYRVKMKVKQLGLWGAVWFVLRKLLEMIRGLVNE